MKRVLTALVLIPLVLILVFLGPKWLISLAVAGVAALPPGSAWNCRTGRSEASAHSVLVAILALLPATSSGPIKPLPWLDSEPWAAGLLHLLPRWKSVGQRLFLHLLPGLRRVQPVALPALREDPDGNGATLVTFLCARCGRETFAACMLAATLPHKLAPQLSPNKT